MFHFIQVQILAKDNEVHTSSILLIMSIERTQYVPTLENISVYFTIKDEKIIEQSLQMLITIANSYMVCQKIMTQIRRDFTLKDLFAIHQGEQYDLRIANISESNRKGYLLQVEASRISRNFVGSKVSRLDEQVAKSSASAGNTFLVVSRFFK